MKLKSLLLVAVFTASSAFVKAQQWVEEMQDMNINFYQVQATFNSTWADKENVRGNGYKQFRRYEYFMEPRVYPTGNRINSKILWEEATAFEKVYGRGNSLSKSNSWRPLGPDNWRTYSSGYSPGLGRVNNVRVDPNDSLTMYIGTPSGGCWKSTDGGLNWTPLADDLAVIGVSDIAISPRNSNVLYIATGDGFGSDTYSIGIMKSTDGGQTWNTTTFRQSVSNQISMRRMLIHPTNPDTLWVATNTGLWRTNDGGIGWVNVLNDDIRSVIMHPTDTSIVYASTDQFYRSTDGGNTFIASNNGTGMNQAANINRMEIAVSPASPNVVYAVCGNQSDAGFYGLYRSNDSGRNFSRQSTSPNILSWDQSGSGSGGQSWYDLAITVNSQDADDVFVGGVNAWKSTDGGRNWNIVSHWVYPSNVGYTHADIHALEFYNNKLYCGSDGGVFVSNDLGSTWTDLSAGLEITQFYKMSHAETNDTILLGGAQDNGSMTTDANGIWAQTYGADGMDNAIDPTNPNIMYFTSQFGNIRRSINGGNTQSDISSSIRGSESGAWVTPLMLEPGNPFSMYAAYENVWYSANRGTSWTRISNFNSANTLRVLEVAPSNANIIYTAPNSNALRKTTNRGATWTNVSAGLPNLAITDIEINPRDPDSVWVTFSGFTSNRKVYLSPDGGSTWLNYSTNLPNLPVNTIAIDSVTGIEYVGTDVGVYTRDLKQGPFWSLFTNGLPNVIVNELEIHYPSKLLRAATYGRGIWETDLTRPTITSVREIQAVVSQNNYTLYPNPNRGAFDIQDEAGKARQAQIFDQQGRMVYNHTLAQANIHRFELESLSKGIYLLRLIDQQGKAEDLKLLIQE